MLNIFNVLQLHCLAIAIDEIIKFLYMGLKELIIGIIHTVVLFFSLFLEVSADVEGCY